MVSDVAGPSVSKDATETIMVVVRRLPEGVWLTKSKTEIVPSLRGTYSRSFAASRNMPIGPLPPESLMEMVRFGTPVPKSVLALLKARISVARCVPPWQVVQRPQDSSSQNVRK